MRQVTETRNREDTHNKLATMMSAADPVKPILASKPKKNGKKRPTRAAKTGKKKDGGENAPIFLRSKYNT